jgi:HSP20 family protein
MAIAKYDTYAELPAGFRFFEDTLNRILSEPTSVRPWSPAVDILETENELVLKADLPDVSLEDIDIRMENGTLTLRGERKFEKSDTDKGYHRIERSFGTFMRAFSVPETVDTDKIKADYAKGVLTVTFPKKEVAKPRAIKVQVKSNE